MADASERESMDFGDDIDKATFDQILDMDEEDDEREFSKSIVFGFFEQAEQTFEKMNAQLKNRNLAELSSLGHFLKGSSATLGFNKVKDECEKIQNFGKKKDETGTMDEADEQKCLNNIYESLNRAEAAYENVKVLMQRFFGVQ